MSKVQVDFWNVGQGDGSTITLPDGTLIVIDVGPLANSLSKWLSDKRNDAHTIKHLILTHNDSDHTGGLESIVHASVSITQASFLDDHHDISTCRSIIQLLQLKTQQLQRLECRSGDPYVLESWDDYKLELRYPSFDENIMAQTSNATSGILVLSWKGKDCIAWGADNYLTTMSDHIGRNIDMQFGPHHGAPQDFKKKEAQHALKCISPQYCFISVGSSNRYKHPNISFIKKLCEISSVPMCSQLTKKCSEQLFFKGQDIHNSAGLYCLPLSKRPNIQCCGHLRFFLDNGCFEFHEYSKGHKERIIKLGYKTACLSNLLLQR